MEDPYHYDPNELPLPQMQYKLNERLIAVTHTARPLAFTDAVGLGANNTVTEVRLGCHFDEAANQLM